MRFLHAMVRVANLEESLRFYCDALGLKEVYRSEHEKGQFTLVYLSSPEDYETAKETKSPLIELTYNWPQNNTTEDYGNSRNFGHLAFSVDNIYEVCKKVQSFNIPINRPPRDGRMAFFKSPDNISIELLQKGKALPPAEPWTTLPNQGSW